ncbi:MAG TPA: penicillin-binding protein 2, partial [Deltaproteobacteria bacterium]|nr:penicillin-binding protein 2 [Deltaproteobacteria bacterium]
MKDKREWIRVRISIIAAIFLVGFGIIFLRAFQLQIVKKEHLEKRARLQYLKTIRINSKRGVIYDRNLKELAVSVEVPSIYAQPQRIKEPREVAGRLAKLLAVDRHSILKNIGSSKRFVWVKRQVLLTDEKKEEIRRLTSSGIGMIKESRRFYPKGELAANLIGFAGIDSEGLEGVELYYDRYLKGSSMLIRTEKDATGRTLLFEDISARAEGMDVVLTIDGTIQYIVEKALKRAVEKAEAKAGVAIVMDPYTGEILAMANVPSFDPNNFTRYSPSYWRNRAITDAFEPGSIMKTFLLAAVLEEGLAERNDIFYCENGRYAVANTVFHDTKKYGWLSLKNIIKYSSNIGAIKLAERLGKERFYRYLKAFGFGDKTGVELPGEATGLVRSPQRWSAITLDTMAFGQGLSTTAIQLVNAVSAIANGGFLMKPLIVKYIRNHEGQIVKRFDPVVVRRVISEETARKVTNILISVTEKGGTGELAALGMGSIKVAGKTGTAQKPDLEKGGYADGKYIASFLGFVPARKPHLA